MWAAQKADVMASHLDSMSVAETAYWMVDLTAAHLASRMAETSAKQRAD